LINHSNDLGIVIRMTLSFCSKIFQFERRKLTKLVPAKSTRAKNLVENFPSVKHIKLMRAKAFGFWRKFWIYIGLTRGDEMYRLKLTANFIAALSFAAFCAIGSPAQSQPDSQAGAQLGEQSALAGKQAQGANTQKTTETSPTELTTFVTGTIINAELNGSLDSKKLKPGDAVNVHTATDLKTNDGRIVLPKGTKIIGHVTQASARGAGQPESSLGLIFDKAILKSGQEIPLNASVQAVGAPPSSSFSNQAPAAEPLPGARPTAPGGGVQSGSTASRGGSMNGASSTPNGIGDPSVGANSADTTNSNAAGQWDANTRGVVGMRNLSLNAAGEGQGSVIKSNGKNVKLDSGTRLLLVTGPVADH
jgi:hypothetical protein